MQMNIIGCNMSGTGRVVTNWRNKAPNKEEAVLSLGVYVIWKFWPSVAK